MRPTLKGLWIADVQQNPAKVRGAEWPWSRIVIRDDYAEVRDEDNNSLAAVRIPNPLRTTVFRAFLRSQLRDFFDPASRHDHRAYPVCIDQRELKARLRDAVAIFVFSAIGIGFGVYLWQMSTVDVMPRSFEAFVLRSCACLFAFGAVYFLLLGVSVLFINVQTVTVYPWGCTFEFADGSIDQARWRRLRYRGSFGDVRLVRLPSGRTARFESRENFLIELWMTWVRLARTRPQSQSFRLEIQLATIFFPIGVWFGLGMWSVTDRLPPALGLFCAMGVAPVLILSIAIRLLKRNS